MRLLVGMEQRFLSGTDDRIYTLAPEKYAFWRQYLDCFENVVVLARVKKTAETMPAEQRADGPGVTFWELPSYTGPAEYLRNLLQLRSAIRKAVASCDAYILRVPGAIGNLAVREIRHLGRGYAVQVLGDPWEVFSPGAVQTPLRPVYRRLMVRSLQRNCRRAIAVAYVTQTLQARYSASAGAYTCSFSDVVLDGHLADADVIAKRKQRVREIADGLRRPVRLGFAGSLEVHYKGADVLIKALAICLRRGLLVEAHLAGDGRSRPQFEALAQKLGVSSAAHFHGHIPAGKAVFEFLDSIDIFVMPSRTEGLPRTLLEAMARGCPCIASSVGGIPELLPPEALVSPSDAKQLAAAIHQFISEPSLMARMIERNADIARGYRPEILRQARYGFLQEVRSRLDPTNLCKSWEDNTKEVPV
jgi:phosphatidylinositol alpha-1,6-mannosyltransferase